jgi:hypothetical protein
LGVRTTLRLAGECGLYVRDWFEWVAVGVAGVNRRDEPIAELR